MSVDISVNGDTVTAKLKGRLDSVSSNELEEAVKSSLSSDIRTVIFDMTDLEFVSSKGLRILISILRSLPGGDVRLRNPNSFVKEVIRITGLLSVFRIEEQ